MSTLLTSQTTQHTKKWITLQKGRFRWFHTTDVSTNKNLDSVKCSLILVYRLPPRQERGIDYRVMIHLWTASHKSTRSKIWKYSWCRKISLVFCITLMHWRCQWRVTTNIMKTLQAIYFLLQPNITTFIYLLS